MKVLHVIDSGGFYGAEAMLVELALEQKRQGLDVTICSIGVVNEGVKAIEQVCKEKGIEVFELRMSGLNLLGGLEIARYANENGFDLIHSHGYKGNILLGILPKKITKLPLITTLHGWTSASGLTKMRVYETLDSLLLSRMDGVVLVSEAMLKRREISGRKLSNLTVINNGISITLPKIESNDPLAKNFRALKSEGPLIGSIGRLSYEKGFDILLEAFSTVLNRNPKAKLVIIGEGHLRKELELYAKKLGVFGSTLFTGYTEQAGKYVSEFDVYVNSSRTEGTPITLLECLRAGKAIIATDVGGNTKIVEKKRGLLVQSEDSENLAYTLLKYLADDRLIDSELQKKYFNYHFSSIKMERSYLKLYQTLLS